MTFRHKQRRTSLQFIIPENLDNSKYPKRDLYGSKLHGKQKKRFPGSMGTMGEGITGGKRIGGELKKIYSSIKRII